MLKREVFQVSLYICHGHQDVVQVANESSTKSKHQCCPLEAKRDPKGRRVLSLTWAYWFKACECAFQDNMVPVHKFHLEKDGGPCQVCGEVLYVWHGMSAVGRAIAEVMEIANLGHHVQGGGSWAV